MKPEIAAPNPKSPLLLLQIPDICASVQFDTIDDQNRDLEPPSLPFFSTPHSLTLSSQHQWRLGHLI
jgi:hypothetical protein